MMLGAPWLLLFGLSIPIVVILYLLKVRLRELEVSSTYLWERLLRDLSAQDPWQRPRFTLLMLVQILILALLSLALAKPAWLAMAQETVFDVIVLDTSASMQATDVPPTRFEEARRQAHEAIDALPEGSTVAILLAGGRQTVAQVATVDKMAALNALRRVQAGDGALDFGPALRLATAMVTGHQKGRIDVFTDGAFDRPNDFPDRTPNTQYHLVGGSDNNQAITAIAVRAAPQNNRQFSAFVHVQNNAGSSIASTLALYVDGTVIDERNLTLGPSAGQDLVFDRLPSTTQVVEARIVAPDALAADSKATSVMDRQRLTKILLVSAGNIFLERALATLPNVDLYRTDLRRYIDLDVTQYDLVVLDNFLPDALPLQNMLVINPPDSPILHVEGSLNRPPISAWESASPLLRYVSFQDIQLQKAAKSTAPGWAKTIVETDQYPLLLAGEMDGQRVVILTFDLQQSNLPLTAAFPILIANTVGYLEPSGILTASTVKQGTALTIQPLPQASETTVIAPNGEIDTFVGPEAIHYDRTDQVGAYTVVQKFRGNAISTAIFAVNLTNASESDIRPRAPQDLTAPDNAKGEGRVPAKQPLWAWLTVSGLALLTGEWWWYHRWA